MTAVRAAGATVVLLLAGLLILPGLARDPIHIWDEARHANNALEMLRTGDLLVTRYRGLPEIWNGKPPLVAWSQAGLMLAIGANEWAVRLPSALAALGTCLLLVVFGWRTLRAPGSGELAVLVLLSARGFFGFHIALTGDTDAMLTLFVTGYVLAWYLYLTDGRDRWLYLTGALVLGAIFTKSVAALIPLPGLLLFTVLMRRARDVLASGRFWLTVAATLVPVAAYYIGREHAQPGYLRIVWNTELAGRYLAVVEKHGGTFATYVTQLLSGWLGVFFIALPFALVALVKDVATRPFGLLATCHLGLFFLIHSISQTKLHWYLAPALPIAALAIGLAGARLLRGVPPVAALAAVVATVYLPLTRNTAAERARLATPAGWEQEAAFMRRLHDDRPDLKTYTVVMPVPHAAFLGAALFYAAAYGRDPGTHITVASVLGAVPGATYLSCHAPTIDLLQRRNASILALSEKGDCAAARMPR